MVETAKPLDVFLGFAADSLEDLVAAVLDVIGGLLAVAILATMPREPYRPIVLAPGVRVARLRRVR